MAERFRKKPVEIEAMRLTPDSAEAICNWMASAVPEPEASVFGDGRILIQTLEDPMTARVGDWIIRGIKGEFYPCKPDIFESTYERVAPGVTA